MGSSRRGLDPVPIRSRSATDEDGRRRVRERPPLPEPLPIAVADSHCHLDIADHDSNDEWSVGALIETAASVGVPRIVQVGYDLASSRWSVDLAEQYGSVVAAVAVHPNEAPRLAERGELDDALADIERLARSSTRVRAIGETGLDSFRTGLDGRAAQRESFAAHAELARRLELTLVVHDRDAHAEVLEVLDAVGSPDRVVMHCFSGDANFARACLDRGFWLSFAGTVTFKNAPALRAALAAAPADRVLVETDAPFLTPEPYRGRPNASYLVPLTVRRMAEVLGMDLEQLCGALAANTDAAFGGAWG